MSEFRRISADEARQIMQDDDPVIVDVRDDQAHRLAAIEGAIQLSNDNLQEFLDQTPRDRPVLVYCYHGNSSLNAAQFLQQQGFENVMSIDGGFEAWRQQHPTR